MNNEATFQGIDPALLPDMGKPIYAAATCPLCGRTGKVRVSSSAIVPKTMFCTDCTDQKDHEFEKQSEARR